jgi:hypothetical protein
MTNSLDTLYGLLDVDQNFFYVVDKNQAIIDRLYLVMAVDTKIVKVDLHACSNWMPNQIDNDVCPEWGLGFFDKDYRSTSLMGNDSLLINHSKSTSEKTLIIIQNLNYVKKILFEIDANSPAFDYQRPKNIVTMFADDAWVTACAKKELDYAIGLKSHWQDHLTKIYQLMQSHSIHSAHYPVSVNQCIKEFATQATPDIIFLHNLYD